MLWLAKWMTVTQYVWSDWWGAHAVSPYPTSLTAKLGVNCYGDIPVYYTNRCLIYHSKQSINSKCIECFFRQGKMFDLSYQGTEYGLWHSHWWWCNSCQQVLGTFLNKNKHFVIETIIARDCKQINILPADRNNIN